MDIYIPLTFAFLLAFAAEGHEMRCPKNSVFRKCADPCPKVCGLKHFARMCHKMPCTSGCECVSGFILSKQGYCISVEDCMNEKCGINAIHKDKPCTSTCDNMFQNTPCIPDLIPGCQCVDGYFMNMNGDCISSSECTVADVQCAGNETFSFCASSCPISCSNIYLTEPCNLMCNLRCDCNPGFIYNSDGKCVLPTDCQRNEVTCPISGQIFTCGFLRTCENMYKSIGSNAVCKQGCFCAEGTVLDTATNRCVPYRECENSWENRACKNIDENMIYHDSHKPCISTCEDSDPVCSGDNISGCFCREGYVMNGRHKCIQSSRCCRCKT